METKRTYFCMAEDCWREVEYSERACCEEHDKIVTAWLESIGEERAVELSEVQP